MDYRVEVSPAGDYVILTMEGEITATNVEGMARSAIILADDVGTNRFLVDARLARNVDSPVANARFAHRIEYSWWPPKNSRTAIVTAIDDHTHDFVAEMCAETTAVVRMFTDMGEATRWIEGS